jgi:aspartate racemase
MTGALTAALIGGSPLAQTLAVMAAVEARAMARTAGARGGLLVAIVPTDPDARRTEHDEALTLAAAARRLEAGGADFIALASSTAHIHQFEIERAIGVPFVSKIEETGTQARARTGDGARVGLLASQACVASGLYQAELARRGLECLTLDETDRAAFDACVAALDTETLRTLARRLGARGASLLVITHPWAHQILSETSATPVINPAEALAAAIVDYAAGDRPLPSPFSSTTSGPA